jgi:hypothetical protein
VTEIVPDQVVLGKEDVLDGMGSEEPVLTVHERSQAGFRRSAADESEISRVLNVLREDKAPAAVEDSHNIIVAGMNIQ